MKEIVIRRGNKGYVVVVDKKEDDFNTYDSGKEIDLLEAVGRLIYEGLKVKVLAPHERGDYFKLKQAQE